MSELEQLARQEKADGKPLIDENIPSIFQEYEKKIPLPERNNRKQWILAVVGLVGSGKTTVVKSVAERLGMARISTDMLRHILAENGFNMLRVVDLSKMITQKYLEAGYSVAIDGDSIAPEHRELFAKAAKFFGIPMQLIHMNTPEVATLERLNQNITEQHSGLVRIAEQSIEDHVRRKPLHEKHLSEITFDAEFDISKPNFDHDLEGFITALRERGF